MKKTLGKIIKILIVIGILGGAYVFFVNNDGGSTQSLTAVPQAGQVSAVRVSDIVFLLNELKTFEIDTGVFSNPALSSLEDFRTALPSEPQGRNNPFFPLGGFSQ